MQYKSFRIRNFKGIKDTTVNFDTIGGAAVFALVGLNESGKTTVLEAIHSFSPDRATSELTGSGDQGGTPFNERVPRHLLSNFTGEVSVVATLSVSEGDKRQIRADLLRSKGLEIESLPNEINFERHQTFENGDFVKSFFSLRADIYVKTTKQRKWHLATGEERTAIRDLAYQLTPNIAYFPTFVFDFPERIYLTERGGAIHRFYRTVFQDILDYDGRGQTIEKDIVRRLRHEDLIVPWLDFLTGWREHDADGKILQVMDRASAAVTKAVFGRWNKIFGEDTRGKEIAISYELTEGETKDARGTATKTNAHDIYIKFQIRDGTRRFDVNDRSLGFRWFFAFMLFTQFRVARTDSQPLLFLFDEPASNLHAAAQQKLIECFPEIARDGHTLAYTTHSHYMIEPKWLEQTFIVTNRADAPADSILDDVSLDDESLDIQVETYRSFVNKHPSQTSYFQPILDRLEVVPSRFDIQRSGVVVEGRSDYYILRYIAALLKQNEMPIIPGMGAGTFGALAAMQVGWNLNLFFLLDSDGQGKLDRKRYVENGISSEKVLALGDLVEGLVEIEDLIDVEADAIIRGVLQIDKKVGKPQLKRFFQERLASDNVVSLGTGFDAKAGPLLTRLQDLLGLQS